MRMLIKIPKRFYDDHKERDLPSPAIVKRTKNNYWIDTVDGALPDLVADAKFYMHRDGPDYAALRTAARWLLQAIRASVFAPVREIDPD